MAETPSYLLQGALLSSQAGEVSQQTDTDTDTDMDMDMDHHRVQDCVSALEVCITGDPQDAVTLPLYP